jgi:hypothetical protein
MADATREGSVHLAVTVTQGAAQQTIAQDSGRRSGRQIVTLSNGSISAVVVGGKAYVEGNANGLADYLDFPTKVAADLASLWISYRRSDPGYAAISSGVTLGEALRQLRPQGTLTKLGPSVVDGQPVIGVRGDQASGSVTLYVSTTGSPLPVEAAEQATSAQTTFATVVLSNWHEELVLRAPLRSVPISSITSTTAPSG